MHKLAYEINNINDRKNRKGLPHRRPFYTPKPDANLCMRVDYDITRPFCVL